MARHWPEEAAREIRARALRECLDECEPEACRSTTRAGLSPASSLREPSGSNKNSFNAVLSRQHLPSGKVEQHNMERPLAIERNLTTREHQMDTSSHPTGAFPYMRSFVPGADI